MARLIRTSNQVEIVEPGNGSTFEYEEAARLVGGSPIEVRPSQRTTEYVVCVANAALLGQAPNRLATFEVGTGSPIHGDALFAPMTELAGLLATHQLGAG